jgi:hypothetical protein
MSNLTLDGDNPLQMFLYALRAPESKRQYPRRLKVFLDYLTNKGELKCSSVLEDECKEFLIKIKESPKWANGQLMEFILFESHSKDSFLFKILRTIQMIISRWFCRFITK